MKTNPLDLADQVLEYLDGGVNPLECWPLLEQLDRELTKLFGPPGRFPNCHPRLQARIIEEGFPVLFVLDFSAPDIDHAHGFRGTREELIGEELDQLRSELLVAVRGWRRKLHQQASENGQKTDTKKKSPPIPQEAWDAYRYREQRRADGHKCTQDDALDYAIGANNRKSRGYLKKQMRRCKTEKPPRKRRTYRGH